MNQCPWCSFDSECEALLNNHININHENLTLLGELDVDNKLINCLCEACKCEPQFQPLENIKTEIKEELFLDEISYEDTALIDPLKSEPTGGEIVKHINKWFTCEQCSYKSRERSNLKRHHSLKHGDGKEITWHRCEHCPYQSKQKSTLKTHMKHKHLSDDEIKWYYCEHCPYKTKTKSCLAYHQFQHAKPENIPWFQCEHCDYKAKTRGRLNKHVSELHSAPGNIKWLKCEYCPYITRRNSSLKQHALRKHARVIK
jgi:hypothetical protein